MSVVLTCRFLPPCFPEFIPVKLDRDTDGVDKAALVKKDYKQIFRIDSMARGLGSVRFGGGRLKPNVIL